jgi:hypothetical protein
VFERVLNGVREREAVRQKPNIDLEALLREIAAYLAAVDAFRAAACEPTWLPEPGA